MVQKVVNLKDFKRGITESEVFEKETKQINKVVITFDDGTTEEVDRGMLLTLLHGDEDDSMGVAVIGLNNNGIANVVRGFAQFAMDFTMDRGLFDNDKR